MAQERFEGKVWRFGANIDTDVIIAARYLNTSDENILARHIMEDARAGFADMVASGDIMRFGANIDTDVIIAARYLNTSDENILARHIMEDARAGFADMVASGDIIVADENFGCGSSREHAPLALKAAGIACVIAPSFARIFYRNAFNMGLLILAVGVAGSTPHLR